MPRPTHPASLPAVEAAVCLRLFGLPQVTVRGRAVPLALKRAMALLAHLALQAQPVPRAHLAALLWPDVADPVARTRLRRLLHGLQGTLGCQPVVAQGDNLALAPGVTSDAAAFTAFAREGVGHTALARVVIEQAVPWVHRARLPLLQGLAFGSDLFDDWLQGVALEHQRLLMRLVERVTDALAAQGDAAAALDVAEVALALDPCSEPHHVRLMQLHAAQGHAAGVQAAYARCAQVLQAEFGLAPSAATQQAREALLAGLAPPSAAVTGHCPTVRYAPVEAGTVAYTVLGQGEHTLVVAPGFVCHIEIALEQPGLRRFIEALAQHFRVIVFDRRGLGLSERLQASATPAALADDLRGLLDHAGVTKAWVFGSSEGALGALRLAIDHPQRVQGLCLFGALARGSAAPDYPWALPAPAFDIWLQRLVAGWGGPVGLDTFAPSAQHDPALRAWWARLVRHAASPGALRALLTGLREADLRAELAHINVPTLVMHRRGDRAVRLGAGEHLAQHIAGATWCPLDGDDHFWWCGDTAPVLQAMQAFMAG